MKEALIEGCINYLKFGYDFDGVDFPEMDEELFRKMSPDRNFDIDALCDSLNIDIHGSSDEVSRLEFSMLLDAAVDPFGSMPVDIYGRTRTALVNPLTGSGGHGHVFVGANVPHGMVAVGPNNVSEGWDWCSGYHDSDRTIAGFAQNHLSGTGIADLGEIVLMPFAGGEAHMEKGTGNGDGYAEKYDKQDETVMPGYYSVRLKESGILAEMTASEHVALHRYTWASAEEGNGIVLDLKSAPKSIMGRQGHLSSGIRKISDKVFAVQPLFPTVRKCKTALHPCLPTLWKSKTALHPSFPNVRTRCLHCIHEFLTVRTRCLRRIHAFRRFRRGVKRV